MKAIKLLKSDWSYPVCQHPKQLHDNIIRVMDYLFFGDETRHSQIVGIGTSGAMLLGAMAGLAVVKDQHTYTLLRKPSDNTAQGRNYIKFNKNPIVVIDDHITEGRTLSLIAKLLEEEKVKHLVIGVIARSWNCGNPAYFNKHLAQIIREFPNVKFWGH